MAGAPTEIIPREALFRMLVARFPKSTHKHIVRLFRENIDHATILFLEYMKKERKPFDDEALYRIFKRTMSDLEKRASA